MVELHTHSLLSDGALLPCELIRRAEVKGYKAVAVTDHVDFSNIDFVVRRIVKTCEILNRYWQIKAIPGVEITHVPPRSIKGLVKFARKNGAKIVIGHGETISEPVLPGTNRAFIEAKVDILAHPGMIKESDVKLAKSKGVFLEVTMRKAHSKPNKRLIKLALKYRTRLVLNTDAHAPEDIPDVGKRMKFLTSLGVGKDIANRILTNSYHLI